jgi:hypothetical protein
MRWVFIVVSFAGIGADGSRRRIGASTRRVVVDRRAAEVSFTASLSVADALRREGRIPARDAENSRDGVAVGGRGWR